MTRQAAQLQGEGEDRIRWGRLRDRFEMNTFWELEADCVTSGQNEDRGSVTAPSRE